MKYLKLFISAVSHLSVWCFWNYVAGRFANVEEPHFALRWSRGFRCSDIYSPCFRHPSFTPFRFNATCQFTPIPNLRSLDFRFNTLRLAALYYANFFPLDISFIIYLLLIYVHFSRNNVGVKQGLDVYHIAWLGIRFSELYTLKMNAWECFKAPETDYKWHGVVFQDTGNLNHTAESSKVCGRRSTGRPV